MLLTNRKRRVWVDDGILNIAASPAAFWQVEYEAGSCPSVGDDAMDEVCCLETGA